MARLFTRGGSLALVFPFVGSLAVAGAAFLSQPRIDSLQPESPATAPRAQAITILGDDFRPGLTLHVTRPAGDAADIGGTGIRAVRPTQFQADVLFDVSGTYELVVANDDGGRSGPFRVKTGGAAQQMPRIDNVSPPQFERSREPQAVTITGSNFEPGLRVDVTDPAGNVTGETALDKADARLIAIRLVFDKTGSYALRVTNPSGGSSNSVTVNVR